MHPSEVAAMLSLGAAGTVHGTLFLASHASLYKPEAKNAVLAADGADTIRSYAFDLLGGTTGWPKGIDGRALVVDSLQELEGMEQDVVPPNVDVETLRGRKEMIVWAGLGVGHVKAARDATVSHPFKPLFIKLTAFCQEIVYDLRDGAIAALRGAYDRIVFD
jgi:nitronate monooxygenase